MCEIYNLAAWQSDQQVSNVLFPSLQPRSVCRCWSVLSGLILVMQRVQPISWRSTCVWWIVKRLNPTSLHAMFCCLLHFPVTLFSFQTTTPWTCTQHCVNSQSSKRWPPVSYRPREGRQWGRVSSELRGDTQYLHCMNSNLIKLDGFHQG